jgi:hypothetical protein
MSTRSKIIVACQLIAAIVLFFVALVTPWYVWALLLFIDFLCTPDVKPEED